jgi:hypothetical protein
MANITKITGIDELVKKLEIKRRRSMKEDDGTVVTGFQAKYALWVHEMKQVNAGKPRTGKREDGSERKGNWWDGKNGQGQPKYLEQPARELHNSGELKRIVRNSYENGATLSQALVTGALRIQREAQLLVPVDLGNLKGSAFTENEL